MPRTPITFKTRRPDRCWVEMLTPDGWVVSHEILPDDYAALGLPPEDPRYRYAPPGVTPQDWEAGRYRAIGGCPDYDGAGQRALRVGEIAELPDRFEVGAVVRGVPCGLAIPKADVTVSRAGGLTLTPRRGTLPAGIVSISRGVVETTD